VTKNLKVGLLAAGAIALAAVCTFAAREAMRKNQVAVNPVAPAQHSSGTEGSGGAAMSASQPAAAGQNGAADILQSANGAFFSCHAPADLPLPPDGATASKDEMTAAHRATATFNDDMNHYLDCLQSTDDGLKAQYRGVASAQDLAQLEALHTDLHNAAVDRLQSDVQRFNQELVKFKASQPPRH
jgi:hypothetical protein